MYMPASQAGTHHHSRLHSTRRAIAGALRRRLKRFEGSEWQNDFFDELCELPRVADPAAAIVPGARH